MTEDAVMEEYIGNTRQRGRQSPPTIMQESLMVTCIIDTMEGRDVAVANIPSAFFQIDMVHDNRIVRVRICGVLADLLFKIDPATFSYKSVLEGGHTIWCLNYEPILLAGSVQ